MSEHKETPQEKKAHVYEIDLIRAITVFSVYLIHAIPNTKVFVHSKNMILGMNLTGHLTHYNREMFMFVTAFVLTYVYFDKPFSVKKFWGKRMLYIIIPYVLWSFIYVKYKFPAMAPDEYWVFAATKTLIGGASYQLYYILLTIEFYAIFPLFLLLLQKTRNKPWMVLGISFVVQILFMFFDFVYLQHGDFRSHLPSIAQTLIKYQDRNFLTYQLFFAIGGFAALYMNEAQEFLVKKGKYIGIGFVIATILYASYYLFQVNMGELRAGTVFQPSVVVFTVCAIVFFSWIATLWGRKRPGYRLVHSISQASFGIYLCHVLFIYLMNRYFVPIVPSALPPIVKVVTYIFLTFSISAAFSMVLLKIPFLSWTVGRKYPKIVHLTFKKLFFFRRKVELAEVPVP